MGQGPGALIPAFVAGLALTGLAIVAAPRAPAAWARLRTGAWPSATGVVLRLEPPPPGVAPPGAPVVLLRFENVGRAPAPFAWREVPGDEVGFHAETDAGRVAPRPPDVAQAPPASPAIRTTELAPGASISLVCDLRRWLVLPPGPVRLRLRADRAPLEAAPGRFAGHHCRSAEVTLDLP